MKPFLKNTILFLLLSLLFVEAMILLLGGTGKLRNVSYLLQIGDGLYTKVRETDTVRDVDVLFLGSSHAYRTFDPRIFDSCGLHIVNLGSSNQTPLQSEVLLRTLLQRVNPRLVVMEVHPDIMVLDGVESAIYMVSNMPPSWPMVRMALRTRNWRVLMTALYAMPHNGLSPSFRHFVENEEGYVQGGFVEHPMECYSPQPIESKAIVSVSQQEEALARCVAYLKGQGVPYLLLEVPDTKVLTDSYTNLSDFQDAMRQYGNYHYYPVPLDDSLHFYNANHLNQRGVEIYDAFIIDTLIAPALGGL